MPADRPNLVLVVLDTARADAFEPYGAARGASPVVSDLARSGRWVRHAYSTANWTLPSHVSLLSGTSPRAAGLGQAPGGRPDHCPPLVEQLADRWLPAVLRSHGYRTRGVSANLWVSPVSGFSLGFDEFVQVSSRRRSRAFDFSWRNRLRWAAEAAAARVDDGAVEASGVIDRWLADTGPEPFFWFVNLVECHSPYLPPQRWNPLSIPQRVAAGQDACDYLDLLGLWSAAVGLTEVPAPALERMRRLYAGAVRQVDDWVGRLLERLEGHGKLADTLVVVTSDHGENLGESGRMGHAFWLDDRLIRVPLVAAGPVPFDSRPVLSLGDLPALLAAALDLSDPPWRPATDPGIAVATSDALTDPSDARIRRAVDEFGFDDYGVWRMTTSATAATDGRWKVLRDGDEEWLYDLSADPTEVAPTYLDAGVEARAGSPVTGLRRAVDRAHSELGQPTGSARRAAPVPSSAGSDAARSEIEDQMRLLGYL